MVKSFALQTSPTCDLVKNQISNLKKWLQPFPPKQQTVDSSKFEINLKDKVIIGTKKAETLG